MVQEGKVPMFGLFNRSRSAVPSSSSPARTRVVVEGLEGRALMSASPLSSGGQASLLPAIQHGLLLPAVHPSGASSSTPGTPAPTGFIIAVL
jgi:hypothetical protein